MTELSRGGRLADGVLMWSNVVQAPWHPLLASSRCFGSRATQKKLGNGCEGGST